MDIHNVSWYAVLAGTIQSNIPNIPRKDSIVSVGICMEVSLNSLEHGACLLFSFLDLLFCDFLNSFGVVHAFGFANGSSIGCVFDFDIVRDLLKIASFKNVSFNDAVAVCAVGFVDPVHSVLHALVLAACIYKNSRLKSFSGGSFSSCVMLLKKRVQKLIVKM